MMVEENFFSSPSFLVVASKFYFQNIAEHQTNVKVMLRGKLAKLFIVHIYTYLVIYTFFSQTEVVRIDEEAQESAKQLIAKSEEMIKTRKVQSNICAAVDALTLCLPVLTTYSKLQSQMKDKRYVKTSNFNFEISIPSACTTRTKFLLYLKFNVPMFVILRFYCNYLDIH